MIELPARTITQSKNSTTVKTGKTADMRSIDLKHNSVHKGFVAFLTIVLFIAFLFLIKDFLVTVVLAALFSGLLYPFQQRLQRMFKGRRLTASAVILVLSLLIVVIPLLGILAIAAREAVQISETLRPWLQEQMSKPAEQWLGYLRKIPFFEELRHYQSNIIEGLSNLLQKAGNYLMQMLSSATTGTVEFFFKAFVGIYSILFFLNTGDRTYKIVTGYLPLTKKESLGIAEKSIIMVRAVIKSLFVIGALQGILVSLAFWFLGIQGAVFWGIVVAVLSALPGVGAPLIWIPAVIYLILTERLWAGIGLAVWGAVIVGLSDNFLRPRIIGQDAKIPELLIFLSMLGGLTVFGLPGFILGPFAASLFVSVLEIYKKVFKRILKS